MNFELTFAIRSPKKRSIVIAGHKTSLTLEDIYWKILKNLSEYEKISIASIVSTIDRVRIESPMINAGLSTTIRQYLTEDLIKRPHIYQSIISDISDIQKT